MSNTNYEETILETEYGLFRGNNHTQKSAQEVYEEWLSNKENPPIVEPNKMEALMARVDGLESINAGLLLENAEHQIKIHGQEKMNKDQEVTNANLLLEIAMLKGAML